MLKLGAPESGWKDILPGVRVQFAPIGIKAVRAARVACGLALKDGDVVEASDALSREMLRRGIVAWEGVGDSDGDPIGPTDLVPVLDADGNPVLDEDNKPKMQAAVELFIADPSAFEAAEQVYVHPWLTRDREKNVSVASSNGTSGEATPEQGTAAPSATPKPKADANPTRKPAREGFAPTLNTSRKRKRAN